MTSATLSRGARVPVFLGLCVLAASILYPVFFLALAAVRTNTDYIQDPLGLPKSLTFDNFVNVWNNYGAGPAFLNSMYVVIVSMVITLLLSLTAGYSLAKLDVPGGRFITGAMVSVLLIPGQVLILPIYLMMSALGIVGDFNSLILFYVATSLPFAVFFLSTSFRAVPDEVLEAARIDGAGFFRTMVSVLLPMSRASVATLAVLQFLGLWNELLYALILLPDDAKRLLTPALSNIGTRYVNDQPLLSAGLLISASVPLLLLMFTSRYVVQGVALGASR